MNSLKAESFLTEEWESFVKELLNRCFSGFKLDFWSLCLLQFYHLLWNFPWKQSYALNYFKYVGWTQYCNTLHLFIRWYPAWALHPTYFSTALPVALWGRRCCIPAPVFNEEKERQGFYRGGKPILLNTLVIVFRSVDSYSPMLFPKPFALFVHKVR